MEKQNKKNTFRRIVKFLKNPYRVFVALTYRGHFKKMDDERYLKLFFRGVTGKKLNLKNPQTFNEKLQWLKLYNRKPVYTVMVDKYLVKKYVADIIGEEYIIPTIGVWDNPDDIDFDSLPDKFVLKCNHNSGYGMCICKDKSKLDIQKVREDLKEGLKQQYFYHGREWPYKDVPPRIIAEKFMQDRNYPTLNVFKIFNFGGVPKIIQTIQNDKTKDETIDYFDTDWNRLDLRQNFPNSKSPLPKPETLSFMLELAKKLSEANKAFLRTDFYEINGKVYFSEFTFFSDCGFAEFYPEHWDALLGSWIKLPTDKE